jgi:hypothetical protein
MPKVVTFGELMVRLQPYNYERFVQADHLEFSFGGGEANVAVSLAKSPSCPRMPSDRLRSTLCAATAWIPL